MTKPIPASEILRAAANAVGGPGALARCLGSQEADLRAWIAGDGVPPFGIALRAAQIASAVSLAT